MYPRLRGRKGVRVRCLHPKPEACVVPIFGRATSSAALAAPAAPGCVEPRPRSKTGGQAGGQAGGHMGVVAAGCAGRPAVPTTATATAATAAISISAATVTTAGAPRRVTGTRRERPAHRRGRPGPLRRGAQTASHRPHGRGQALRRGSGQRPGRPGRSLPRAVHPTAAVVAVLLAGAPCCATGLAPCCPRRASGTGRARRHPRAGHGAGAIAGGRRGKDARHGDRDVRELAAVPHGNVVSPIVVDVDDAPFERHRRANRGCLLLRHAGGRESGGRAVRVATSQDVAATVKLVV